MTWRIVEWRNDALRRRLFLGQLCWLRVREIKARVIGEIVALEIDESGECLIRVKLWVRSLKTTLPRRPRDVFPLQPRAQLRLIRSDDYDPEEIVA